MVYFYDDKGNRYSQIDLLFDRADKTISICEIKYCEGEYKLTKSDINSLIKKKEDLRQYLTMKKKTQKNFIICYITTNALHKNKYFNQIQPSVIKLNDLFM